MTATKLTTKRVEKPWGRTDLFPGFADVLPGGNPIGEVWFEAPGDPELLVKYLFTSQRLSIQDHPDDAFARAHGYARGKDEAWLILAAEPDSTIAIGLKEATTREALKASALDGSIERLVDWKPVKKDESYYSGAGTVHAIGAGLTVIEVQQNVDLTYRLYDYGSDRELHLEDGIAVAEPVPYVAPYVPTEHGPGRTILADSHAFVMERWAQEGAGTIAGDGRPLWLVPVAGTGTIDGQPLEAGTVWLVEGSAALTLDAGQDLLLAYPGGGVIDGLWATSPT